MRGATTARQWILAALIFQSTLPMRGATSDQLFPKFHPFISIHTPHAGSDVLAIPRYLSPTYFNPHSPCGERPDFEWYAGYLIFISIHTPHAGSDGKCTCRNASIKRISIHTPHAGSDSFSPSIMIFTADFNPHSPCGERPLPLFFLVQIWYFNPHSPCGERHLPVDTSNYQTDFNPHSPCGERPQKERASFHR